MHRDVKPGNVLLGADGAVKLTDFGVAVSATSVPLTRTGEVVGTANYLSPEQAEGKKATPASDVYALGLIGYECLAGHRGFDGGTPTQIALRQIREVPPPLPADVPDPVRRLIDRAIAKDPAQRIPDGAALRDAIDDVLAGRAADDAAPRTMVMPAVRSTEPVRTPTPPPPFPATRAFVLPKDDEVHDLAELRALEDDDADAEPAGRRRWPWLLAALLTLLVVAGGTVVFLQLAADRPASTATGTTTGASTSPAVQLVGLALPDFVGRPVAQVQSELAARGLPVTLEPRESTDVPAGQVITVNPVGQVAPGTPITVVYAVAPPPPPTPTPTPDAHARALRDPARADRDPDGHRPHRHRRQAGRRRRRRRRQQQRRPRQRSRRWRRRPSRRRVNQVCDAPPSGARPRSWPTSSPSPTRPRCTAPTAIPSSSRTHPGWPRTSPPAPTTASRATGAPAG